MSGAGRVPCSENLTGSVTGTLPKRNGSAVTHWNAAGMFECVPGSGSTPEYHPNTGHLSQLQSGIHQRHATILNASPAYLSPLLASDEMLHSLPSVALLPSSFDPLLDDSIVMARRLHALGKDVTLHPFDGISHGFLNFHAVSRLAQQATDVCIELMDAAIKQHDQDV
ncbi:uncharacterized protein LOC135820250 isoform X2 [Sycon ciliatum]|uniref:uncharacterized protein LOC135820250 isoform X2 n=1 Tax=Sycon ciliatum TaxID=27933 RepID=UPI0031F6EB76